MDEYPTFSMWHHQHHFRKEDNGTEMRAVVHYNIPYGFLGKGINHLLVKRELDKIFHYPSEQIERLAGHHVIVLMLLVEMITEKLRANCSINSEFLQNQPVETFLHTEHC